MATIDNVFKAQKKSNYRQKSLNKASPIVKEEVHGSTSCVNEADEEIKILKQFDLDSKYGPCTGMTRLERWARAEKFQFDPPKVVREIIERHLTDTNYTLNLWHDMKI